MNELIAKQSSDNVITKKTVWVNGESHEIEVRGQDEEDIKKTYCVYLRGEAYYLISESNFNRIQKAIGDGAKFVRINDDLVNVNEIRKFKKE